MQEIQQPARGLPDVQQVVLSVAQSEEPATRLYSNIGFRKRSKDQGSLHMVRELNVSEDLSMTADYGIQSVSGSGSSGS